KIDSVLGGIQTALVHDTRFVDSFFHPMFQINSGIQLPGKARQLLTNIVKLLMKPSNIANLIAARKSAQNGSKGIQDSDRGGFIPLSKESYKEVTEEFMGFRFNLFVSPKKIGNLRTVLNLRRINMNDQKINFKMESLASVCKLELQEVFEIQLERQVIPGPCPFFWALVNSIYETGIKDRDREIFCVTFADNQEFGDDNKLQGDITESTYIQDPGPLHRSQETT
ncbi:hypothetical protein BB560_004123, partial [Smittium megazygosporum]